jgi:hypothetical protein
MSSVAGETTPPPVRVFLRNEAKIITASISDS